jgi:cell wall integrity and stress response component
MRFSLPNAVLAALFLADRLSAEAYNETTRVDCYSEVPGYKNNGTYTWQTDGYCQRQCVNLGYPVMALHDGLECLCGDEIPPNATKTTGCDSACSGFPSHLCKLPNWR